MVISDHLNLTGRTPLLGPNADQIGPRFQDLTDAWSPRLRAALKAAGAAEDVTLEEGVYAGLLGPQYETPAEVRMLRTSAPTRSGCRRSSSASPPAGPASRSAACRS